MISAVHRKTLLLRLSLLLICPGVLQAKTLSVSTKGPLRSISRAIELAEDGDKILVAGGVYEENLAVNKEVVLEGLDQPVILGPKVGDVVAVLADSAHIRGFSISGSGKRMLHSDAGIKVVGNGVTIENNRLSDNLFGIYLKGCTNARVEGNVIQGRAEDEIGKRGAGVHFYDAHHNRVLDNRISWVRDGVYFDHADFNLVEGNEFSDLRYGVHYMYCQDNSFFRNIFRDSVAGVAVMYTERVVFRGNQIINNRKGYNAFGLLLKDCLDSVAEENVIVNNVNGIFLDNSHRNRFTRNLVAYNDVGVMLYASALGNEFSQNDFIGNQAVLHTVGRADADWSPEGKGNFYSSYAGYDLNEDGIGDIAHRLQDAFEYLAGRRPWLRLFLNGPAADALAFAERSFPLVPSSEEEDNAPAMKPVSGVSITYRYSGARTGLRSPMGAAGLLSLLASTLLFRRWRS